MQATELKNALIADLQARHAELKEEHSRLTERIYDDNTSRIRELQLRDDRREVRNEILRIEDQLKARNVDISANKLYKDNTAQITAPDRNLQKKYSLNVDDEEPKFNHIYINIKDGVLSISSYFDGGKIETAYRRFKKGMTQAAADIPDLKGWDNWLDAKSLTADEYGYVNENGDGIFHFTGLDTLNVHVDEDFFYIWGYFSLTEDAQIRFEFDTRVSGYIGEQDAVDWLCRRHGLDKAQSWLADYYPEFLPLLPDSFDFELARLRDNKNTLGIFCTELVSNRADNQAQDDAIKAYYAAINATQDFCDKTANALRERLLTADLILPRTVTCHRWEGRSVKVSLDTLDIISACEVFEITGKKTADARYHVLGNYYTPAQVETVINQLKDAVERGDKEFSFPTMEELNRPTDDKTDAVNAINAVAPPGWSITANGRDFPVNFNGKTVATIDSLALANILPPDKFFAQFKPLIDNEFSPAAQFLDDLFNEINELLKMRDELKDDSDRVTTITNMIEQIKRDILTASLEPPDDNAAG